MHDLAHTEETEGRKVVCAFLVNSNRAHIMRTGNAAQLITGNGEDVRGHGWERRARGRMDEGIKPGPGCTHLCNLDRCNLLGFYWCLVFCPKGFQ